MKRIGSWLKKLILRIIGCNVEAIPVAIINPGQVIALSLQSIPSPEAIDSVARQMQRKGIQVIWLGPNISIQPLETDKAYRLVHRGTAPNVLKQFMKFWSELHQAGAVGQLIIVPEKSVLVEMDTEGKDADATEEAVCGAQNTTATE